MVFYGLVFVFINLRNTKNTTMSLIIATLLFIVVTTILELSQFLMPTRVLEYWDILAQLVGALVGALFIYIVGPYDKKEIGDITKAV